MYSRVATLLGRRRQREHHEQVERLVETYFHTIDEIQNETLQLAANIRCVSLSVLYSVHRSMFICFCCADPHLPAVTCYARRGSEEIIAMSQDLNRNRIITLNLFASAGAFVVGTGSLVGTVFGQQSGTQQALITTRFPSGVYAQTPLSSTLQA